MASTNWILKGIEYMNLEEIKNRSIKIKKLYHNLGKKHHSSKWSIEEDALAFLTDAGLVGRLTMDNQNSKDGQMILKIR